MDKIILASASPRRKELLGQIGITPCVLPSQVEEHITQTMPQAVVEELSRQKCRDVAEQVKEDTMSGEPLIVLGADTVVAAESKILGKPKDGEDARQMLRLLQGQTHQVYTGVTLIWCRDGAIRDEVSFTEKTDVCVATMSEEEILDYIATGEPMDKAGAYGIQGCFAKYVSEIHGDYNNVVGLPVAAVYQQLRRKS